MKILDEVHIEVLGPKNGTLETFEAGEKVGWSVHAVSEDAAAAGVHSWQTVGEDDQTQTDVFDVHTSGNVEVVEDWGETFDDQILSYV